VSECDCEASTMKSHWPTRGPVRLGITSELQYLNNLAVQIYETACDHLKTVQIQSIADVKKHSYDSSWIILCESPKDP
jgi:hypothetical protein